MKKTVKTKVLAAVLSAVCAVSAVSAATVIGASAAAPSTSVSQSAKEAVIVSKTSGSSFTLPMKGIDWNYFADSLNVKVDCDIDFSTGLCKFQLKAVKPGTANIDLKTKDTDGMWTVTPIRVTVGKDLKMKIVQYDDARVISNSSSSTPASNTKKSDTKKSDAKNNKEAVIVSKTSGSSFTLPMKGIDWNYFADSLNVKVDCDIDFSTGLCKFQLKAVKPGTANIDLRTKDTDGMWTITPIRVTVGNDLKMNIIQSGDSRIAK